jgi:hypothetical protein
VVLKSTRRAGAEIDPDPTPPRHRSGSRDSLRFLRKERDILLATASPLFDYLGLEVVRTKRKKKKK